MDWEKAARRLRVHGVPDVEIAQRLSVDRSTLYRRLGPRKRKEEIGLEDKELPPKKWPPNRRWPDHWTADYLVDEGIRDRQTAERVLLIVEGMKRDRAKWAEWFMVERFKLDIEQLDIEPLKRMPLGRTSVAWRDLSAGLLVLADWLQLSHPLELLEQIKTRPYPLGDTTGLLKTLKAGAVAVTTDSIRITKTRRDYSRSAKPVISSLRHQIQELYWRSAVDIDIDDAPGPEAALNDFLERLPLVDKPKGRHRKRQLSSVFIEIFQHEPPGGN